jgi:DNA-binding GntR family transcriptional regulator
MRRDDSAARANLLGERGEMSRGRALAPARSRTAHEYALRTLREALLDGTLPAGTRLIQSDLAAQLDVSVTPVREALRDLAAEGLVIFDPHRGALVRSLDLAEVKEIYELRMLLEPVMIRRTVSALAAAQIDRADQLRRQMEETESIAAWVELNREFHEAFVQPGDGGRLATILAGLRASASAYVGISLVGGQERLAESNDEHARLVELYRQRNVEGVIELTLQHLQSTLAAIEGVHDSDAASAG